MPRLLLAIFIGFVAVLTGCGLSERERAVADANEAIQSVEGASREVAERIAQIPDTPLTPEHFDDLREALGGYLQTMEQLNAALRLLGTAYPELDAYITATFRPAAESAATFCQEALDTLGSPDSEQDDYRRAVARIGLCIDRYAAAVTNVSSEYARLSS